MILPVLVEYQCYGSSGCDVNVLRFTCIYLSSKNSLNLNKETVLRENLLINVNVKIKIKLIRKIIGIIDFINNVYINSWPPT